MAVGCAEARRPVEKAVDALRSRQFARESAGGSVEIFCALGSRMFHVEHLSGPEPFERNVPRGTFWVRFGGR